MYGSTMGTLSVGVKLNSGAMNKLWTLSGDQGGNVWKYGRFRIPITNSVYKVREICVTGESSFRDQSIVTGMQIVFLCLLLEITCTKEAYCYRNQFWKKIIWQITAIKISFTMVQLESLTWTMLQNFLYKLFCKSLEAVFLIIVDKIYQLKHLKEFHSCFVKWKCFSFSFCFKIVFHFMGCHWFYCFFWFCLCRFTLKELLEQMSLGTWLLMMFKL